MNEELFNEASKSNVLSKKLVDQLQESMDYSSISFINWTIEVLKLLKARIERGDKIKDETTGVIYDLYTFRKFVEENFSAYITGQVFNTSIRSQKVYFSLEACPGGYNLIMADSGNEKTYRWISSLSKRFSLVEMIATGIVYIKDTRTDTYQPFISENGKYCKYNKDLGKLIELYYFNHNGGIRKPQIPPFSQPASAASMAFVSYFISFKSPQETQTAPHPSKSASTYKHT